MKYHEESWTVLDYHGLSYTVTQLGGGIFLALKWVYDESKSFEVHVGELCDTFEAFCAPQIGPEKSKKL